jgi:hypothetical protein
MKLSAPQLTILQKLADMPYGLTTAKLAPGGVSSKHLDTLDEVKSLIKLGLVVQLPMPPQPNWDWLPQYVVTVKGMEVLK